MIVQNAASKAVERTAAAIASAAKPTPVQVICRPKCARYVINIAVMARPYADEAIAAVQAIPATQWFCCCRSAAMKGYGMG